MENISEHFEMVRKRVEEICTEQGGAVDQTVSAALYDLLDELEKRKARLEQQHEELLKARIELERLRSRSDDLDNDLSSDVGGRHAAESDLGPSTELLEKLFATTHLCMAYLDTDFNFVRVNRAYADACGYRPEGMIGLNHFALYPHKENERIFRRVVESGEPFTVYAKPFEFPDFPGRGVTYWDWTLMPVKDEDGAVEGLLFTLLDVTEPVRTRQKINESAQQYRELANALPQTVIECDVSGNITFANRNSFAVFGYAYDDLEQGINVFQLIVPEQYSLLQRGIDETSRTRLSYSEEFTARRRDGSTLPVRIYANPIVREDRVTGFRAIMVDISEQKAMETMLRENEARLVNAQRIAHLGNWERLLDRNVIHWSDEMYRIFGLEVRTTAPSFEEFLGMIHPEDRQRLEQVVAVAIATRSAYTIDFRILWPDGSVRFVTAQGEVTADAAGKPDVIAGTLYDITELKQYEQSLLQEQARLERVVAHEKLVADLSAALNSIRVFHTVLDEWIPRLVRGLEVDDICIYRLDIPVRTVCISGNGGAAGAGEDAPVYGEEFRGFFERFVTKEPLVVSGLDGFDGNHRAMLAGSGIGSMVVFPVVIESEMLGYLLFSRRESYTWYPEKLSLLTTITDIIENAWKRDYFMNAQIAAERERTKAVQISERALRMASIGEMAGGITHEINQPLSAIKVTVDGILYWEKGHGGQIPDEFMKMLEKISASVKRISEIIDHMRTFWVAPRSTAMECFGINGVVTKALSLLQEQLASHGISVTTELYTPGPELTGDRIHLEQIVINLVTNAIYALDEVSRDDKAITIRTTVNNGNIVLEIIDNGIGIPAGAGEKLFDPFFTTRKETVGTGLGLAIVKRFTEAHSGTVQLHKVPAGGTIVTVTFPHIMEHRTPDDADSAC